MGAKFAKWRAVITIGLGKPSSGCIEANSSALARYAALCQEAGLVPIVEPEVLMEGDHTLEQCERVTEQVIRSVFNHLHYQRVILEGVILKPNMILPGLACKEQVSIGDVAKATVECLLRSVPAAVPGIAFLSGGQTAELASARLNAINTVVQLKAAWPLSFSFSRAIQQPALDVWRGVCSNVIEAQAVLLHRARLNSAARCGEYSVAMESNDNKQTPPNSNSNQKQKS